MDQTMYSISAVHRLTGKARSTISKHIKAGDISCTVDDDGKKMIEASELVRVYSNFLELDSDGKLQPKTKRVEQHSAPVAADHPVFEQLLEDQKQERGRERRQLEETIEHLRSDLEKSQQRESRVTLLLEHQSQDSDKWKRTMADIEQRIANQEMEVKKYRKALIDERNKSFWQKLFG